MPRKTPKKTTRKIVKRTVKRRTTHRSGKGKKLYAVRDSAGKFKDIQTYQRAHSTDIGLDAAGEA